VARHAVARVAVSVVVAVELRRIVHVRAVVGGGRDAISVVVLSWSAHAGAVGAARPRSALAVARAGHAERPLRIVNADSAGTFPPAPAGVLRWARRRALAGVVADARLSDGHCRDEEQQHQRPREPPWNKHGHGPPRSLAPGSAAGSLTF